MPPAEQNPPARKSPVGLLVRLAISIGLLWWVLRDAEVRAALTELTSARAAGYLALATLWYTACNVLNAWKWGLILRGMGFSAGLLPVIRAFFIGQFASRFLPTAVGGDVVRPITLTQAGVPYSAGLVSAFLGRVTGLVAMLFLGIFGCLAAHNASDEVPQQILVGITVLCGSSILGLAIGTWVERRWSISARLPGLIGRPLRRTADGIAALAGAPGTMAWVMVVSFVYQVQMVGINILLGAACGLELSAMHWFWYVPVVTLGEMLPSVGGIGPREGFARELMAPLGLAAPAAVCSLLWQAAKILSSLPGGVWWVRRNASKSAGGGAI